MDYSGNTCAYTQRFDYDANNNLIYQGWAQSAVNPLSSEAKWAIQKNTYDVSNRITLAQWANGVANESNIWDNRASLSYK